MTIANTFNTENGKWKGCYTFSALKSSFPIFTLQLQVSTESFKSASVTTKNNLTTCLRNNARKKKIKKCKPI